MTYVFTVACVMLLASCKDKKKAETYTAYRVATLSPTSVEIEESYSASIQGRQDIDIYPQVPGTITRLCVKEGQQVRKGQVLFVIDQVPYRATWNKAVADVHAAEAQARTARLEYRSKQVLFDKQVISEYELTTAKNALDAAEAMLEQMKALEQSARNNLSHTEVKSPSDGMVGTLPYRTGALVSSSIPQPLTTVSDNSETYVYFSLTENRLRSMLRRYGSLDKTINEMPARPATQRRHTVSGKGTHQKHQRHHQQADRDRVCMRRFSQYRQTAAERRNRQCHHSAQRRGGHRHTPDSHNRIAGQDTGLQSVGKRT